MIGFHLGMPLISGVLSSAGGGGPVIPPLPTANLLARYESDAGVNASGSTVTSWNDTSGNGHNAGTIVGSPQLTVDYRGRPVVRFNPDTSDSIASATPNMDIRNVSVFMIGRFFQNNSSYNLLTFNNYAGTNGILRQTGTPTNNFAVGINLNIKPKLSMGLIGFRSGASGNIAYTETQTVTGLLGVTIDTSVDGMRIGTFVGDVYGVYIYSGLTPDIAGIRAYAQAKYAGLASVEPTKNIVFEGDSISQGTTSARTASWVAQVLDATNEDWRMANMAISGSSISTGTTQMANRTTNTDSFRLVGYTRNVLNILIGRNDVAAAGGNLTAAQTYTNLIAYVQARVAAGWEVWVCTTIPTSGSLDSTLIEFNDLIKGVGGGGTGNGIVIDAGATKVIDFRQAVGFQTTADASNTTNYQGDATHPTPVGAGLMAAYFRTQLI
jgi:lysophospholipase L1-like esterase